MKYLATLALAVGLATPALAADKGGAPAAPAPSATSTPDHPWTGCYLGAGVSKQIVVNGNDLGLGSVAGTTVSAEAGCDYQVNHRLVVGVLGRYGLALDGSSTDTGLGSIHLKADRPWLVGGRAGVLVNPSTLAYGLAGVSGIDYKIDGTTARRSGVALGAGVETQLGMLGNRWTFGLEYLWADVDSDAKSHEVSARFKHRF